VARRTALCLAVAAAVLVSSCTAGHPPVKASAPSRPRPAPDAVAVRSSSSVVEHWGSFFGARRGNFDIDFSPAAVRLPGLVSEVGSSNSTEYALLTNGTLYAWGVGSRGELGDGGTASSFVKPVRVRFPAGVKIASIPTDVMPFDTGLAIDTAGRAWGWGLNHGGELCLGNARMHRTPVVLPFSDVTAVAGAANHASYDARGKVYACGQNLDGALGTGSWRSTTTPLRVAGLAPGSVSKLTASFANSGALLSDGEYLDWGLDNNGQLGDGHIGRNSNVPVPVRLRGRVAQVALGGSIWENGQTLVLLSNGSLWDWGSDRRCQLGDRRRGRRPWPIRFHAPTGVTFVSLASGGITSYAISSAGVVYAWGSGPVGQLGDGSVLVAKTPVRVAPAATSISATANNVVISTPAGT
jgi:alpha-tubulin suppressor-like RCC1 family protein